MEGEGDLAGEVGGAGEAVGGGVGFWQTSALSLLTVLPKFGIGEATVAAGDTEPHISELFPMEEAVEAVVLAGETALAELSPVLETAVPMLSSSRELRAALIAALFPFRAVKDALTAGVILAPLGEKFSQAFRSSAIINAINTEILSGNSNFLFHLFNASLMMAFTTSRGKLVEMLLNCT